MPASAEALVASRFSVGGEVETSEFEFRESAQKMRKPNGSMLRFTHTQATQGGKRKGARKGERVIREVDSGANTPCWGAPAFIIFDTRFAKTQIILDISSTGNQPPEFQNFTTQTQTQANPSSKFRDPAPQADI